MRPWQQLHRLTQVQPMLNDDQITRVRAAVIDAHNQRKKILFDYFCGVGGASRGYQQAGFYVVGFDVKPQPNYGGDLFINASALFAMEVLGFLADAHHGSPPCQRFSTLSLGTNRNAEDHPDYIDVFREMVQRYHKPFVIENVPTAPLWKDYTVRLCGEMFREQGVKVLRHRDFECHNFPITQPEHIPHKGKSRGWNHGVYTPPEEARYVPVYGNGGGNADRGGVDVWQDAMQMPWAQTKDELREAIPPSYTKFIGERMMDVLVG